MWKRRIENVSWADWTAFLSVGTVGEVAGCSEGYVEHSYDEQSKLWVDSIDKSNVKHSYDEKNKLWVDSL